MKETNYVFQELDKKSRLALLEEEFINFLQQNNMLVQNQINSPASDDKWEFKSSDNQFIASFTSPSNSFVIEYNKTNYLVEIYEKLNSSDLRTPVTDDQTKIDLLQSTLTELQKYPKEMIIDHKDLDHDQRDLDQKILNLFRNLVLKYPSQTTNQMVAGKSIINFANQQSIKYDNNSSGEEIECNLIDLSDGQEKKYLITKTHDQKILVKEIDQETNQLKDVSIAQKNQIICHLNSLIIPSVELGSSAINENLGLFDDDEAPDLVSVSSSDQDLDLVKSASLSIDPRDYSFDLSFSNLAITENNSTALEIEKLTHFFVNKLLEKGLDITQPMIKDDLTLFIMTDESSSQYSKYSIDIFSSDGEVLTGKKLIDKIFEFSDHYQLDLSRDFEFRSGFDNSRSTLSQNYSLPSLSCNQSSQTFSVDFDNEAEDIDFIKRDFSKKLKSHSEEITEEVYLFEHNKFNVSINDAELSIYDKELDQEISDPLKEMEAIRKIACDLGITLKNILDPELLSHQRLPHNQIKAETPMSGTVNLIFSHHTDSVRSLSTNSPTNPTADNLASEIRSSSPER